mmetsp:Transcript_11915/g.26244  ORF Transcript_11915/g.26244 Transcript_11915/m.26244 type:complete len:95 (-) Transcript_11915:479-763(-)
MAEVERSSSERFAESLNVGEEEPLLSALTWGMTIDTVWAASASGLCKSAASPSLAAICTGLRVVLGRPDFPGSSGSDPSRSDPGISRDGRRTGG